MIKHINLAGMNTSSVTLRIVCPGKPPIGVIVSCQTTIKEIMESFKLDPNFHDAYVNGSLMDDNSKKISDYNLFYEGVMIHIGRLI